MDWKDVLKRFVDLLQEWDKLNPNRYYAYYLNGLRAEDEAALAALLQEAVLSYTACKPVSREVLRTLEATAQQSEGEQPCH